MSAAGRSLSNPLFNSNKLKLGVFFGNVPGGPRPTTASGRLEANWGDVLDGRPRRHRAGFETLIPLANWTGIGGPSKYVQDSYESTAWAAALAQATKQIGIFSTMQVATCNPILAAKVAVTIDHISDGRFSFGTSLSGPTIATCSRLPNSKARRVVRVRERVARDCPEAVVVGAAPSTTRASTSTSRARISDPKADSEPVPGTDERRYVSPRSTLGERRHADVAFTGVAPGDFAATKERVDTLRALAAEQDRSIQVWMAASVVTRETQAEVRRSTSTTSRSRRPTGKRRHCSRLQHGNRSGTSATFPRTRQAAGRQWVGSSLFHQPLWGTPPTSLKLLEEFSNCGLDGMVLTFVNYHDELRRWICDANPLLEKMQLRAPAR